MTLRSLAPLVAALFLAIGSTMPAFAQEQVELIPREALFGNPDRTGVQISPDGRYLSWLAPVEGVMNIWIAPSDNPAAAKAITKDTTRGIQQYFWSYQPGVVLYLRDTGGDENFHLFATDANTGSARDLTPYPKTRVLVNGISSTHPDTVVLGMNDRDAGWHDVYKVDIATGKRELLEKNTQQFRSYLLDEDYVVRMATKALPDGGFTILKPDGKGKWSVVESIPFSDALTTKPIGYAQDGTFYMLDSRNRNTSALYAIDTQGERKLVAEDNRADISGAVIHPRTGVVEAVVSEYLRAEYQPVGDAITEDLAKLKALGSGNVFIDSRTLDDKTWIVNYSPANASPTFYRYERPSGRLTKLFVVRPELEDKPLVPMWPVEIRARDGLNLVGYLTLPKFADPNADGKADKIAPLVLLVHGGPWDRDSYGYSSMTQLLANRDYAVLRVNYRGSTGFGKEFIAKSNQQWAAAMHDDLIDSVQWAVQENITTADQVAIMGGSYGGYATLVGLTFTPKTFKCGVDVVGPSNLNTLASTIPPYWASFLEQFAKRVGDPRTEEGKKLLEERSPLSRVDAIERPLLIIQGANDPRVKQSESDQIVKAMQAKNIPVTYAVFADEGHGFQRPENSKAFNAVTEAFLGKCLGGRVEPIGDDFAGSSISVPVGAENIADLTEALKLHKAKGEK